MDNFDLISALEDYATSKGWVFVYGNDEHRNYEAQQAYDDGEIILGSSTFNVAFTGDNGKYHRLTYSGDLYLGRKFDDDGTAASIDETYKQKYDRRLQDLSSTLGGAILEFSCTHELDFSNVNMRLDINKHDTNIDFVATLITFNQIPE